MSRKRIAVAAVSGASMGAAFLTHAGPDLNGDGFLDFLNGEVITADDINANFGRAADHITLYESTFAIDGSGNVGIGTSSPLDTLDVVGTVMATAFVGDGAGLTGLTGLSQWDDVTGGINFDGGNVGIGTATPTNKLQIVGTSPLLASDGQLSLVGSETTGAADTGGSLVFMGNDGSVNGRVWGSIQARKENSTVGNVSSYLALSTRAHPAGAVEKMRITSVGNVGIGVSDPEARLEVSGAIISGVQDYSINSATYQLTHQSNVDGISGVSPQGAFRWYTNPNNSDRTGFLYQLRSYDTANGESAGLLTVNGAGSVGIGTTAPATALHVVGTSKTDRIIVGGSGYGLINVNVATDNTSAYSLHYPGAIAWQIGRRGSALSIATTGGSSSDVMGSDVLTLAGAGNVGVGTTDPVYKFQVVGTAAATTFVTTSDLRLKKEVMPLTNASEGISCLQGVTYRWTSASASQETQMGLIAQEVESCFPEVVYTDSNGFKSVAYDQLIAPLIETTKEQMRVNARQEQSLKEQQVLNGAQQTEIAALKAQLGRIESLLKNHR